MNGRLITAERSKNLARQLFLSAFPESDGWFDLAWDAALSQTATDTTGAMHISDGLGVYDTANPGVKEMAREFAILFDTFLQKFPIAQEALIERLETNCAKYGRNQKAAQRLKDRLKQNFEKIGDFVVWTTTEFQLKVETEYISQAEAETYLAKQSDYDIFISAKTVKIKGQPGSVDLPPRLYWLLIMFLRYRPRPLPSEESYRKAWQMLVPLSESDLKDVLQKHLRFAVSDLRNKLNPLIEAGKFDIPNKQRDHGYRCEGKFSFCIILDRDLESRVTLKAI